MKKITILPLLSLFLIGCTSSQVDNGTITIDQLYKLQSKPTLDAEQVAISCRIVEEDGTVVMLPTLMTKIGKKTKAEIAKDYIYPTSFELPEVGQGDHSGNIFPVTPAVPASFASTKIGDFLT